MKSKPYIVILGAGESGVGTALLAQQKGYEVFVSDKSAIKEKYKHVLIGNNIPFVDGQIAAIAMAQGLILVTRNTKDFQAIEGLRQINWFTDTIDH